MKRKGVRDIEVVDSSHNTKALSATCGLANFQWEVVLVNWVDIFLLILFVKVQFRVFLEVLY